MQRIKVLHLISPVRYGGGEALLQTLLQQSEAETIVVLQYRSDEFELALDALGVRWIALTNRTLGHGASRRTSLVNAVRTVGSIVRLRSVVGAEQPDVIHVHSFPGSFSIALLKWLGSISIPALLTRHSLHAQLGVATRHVYAWMMSRYECVTTVSEASKSSMQAQFKALDVRVVHNCVADAFFAVPAPPQPAPRATFLQVGRFTPSKNHLLVVRAVAQLTREERRGIAVWFAGAGETQDTVRLLVDELDLADEVKFLGFVPHEELPALMANVNFGLFVSASEGFGIGAAECLAAGRPVLALDTAAMKEVVDGGGLCVADDQLSHGLRRLRASGVALSEVARQSAERFRGERARAAYLALYREFLGVAA